MAEFEIGKAIAELRKNKGLTQAGLADMLNVTDKAVSKWESGNGYPEIFTLVPLAKILGVTTDYLLSGISKQYDYIDIDKLLFDNCLIDGIIDIKKLLSLNKINYIKKGLKEYPIHRIEKLYEMLKEEKWREIYHYSINIGNYNLTKCFTEGNIANVEKTIIREFWYNNFNRYDDIKSFAGINGEYIFTSGNFDDITFDSLNDIQEFLDKIKKTILREYKEKEEYLSSKDVNYYRNKLNEGYPNQTIKELGERLEYVLKYKYPKQEHLSNMFSLYCEEIGLKKGHFEVDQYKNERIVNLMLTFIECYESLKQDREPNSNMLICDINKCLDFILEIK